jgi:hypothetical protein
VGFGAVQAALARSRQTGIFAVCWAATRATGIRRSVMARVAAAGWAAPCRLDRWLTAAVKVYWERGCAGRVDARRVVVVLG